MSESAFAEALTLDQMRVLTAVAEEGSFSGAARKLQRSQAAISYQVANLESQLSLSLFRRTRRRPELTEEGRAVLVAVRDVLTSVEAVRDRARKLGAGLEARLCLAVDVLYPAPLLADHLRDFGEAFPSVRVDLRIGVRAQVTKLLSGGDVDLAVGPSADGFEARECRRVQLVPVVAAGHALAQHRGSITDAELARHRHLVLSDDETAPASEEAGLTWRINDSMARRELLSAGLGWSHLPLHQVEGSLAEGGLVRLRTRRHGRTPLTVALYVAHRRDLSLGPAGRWWFDRL